MKRLIAFGLVFVAVLALAEKSSATEPAKRTLVWKTKELFKTPKVYSTTESPVPGMRAFFYEGASYKGRPTRVFAYYAAPAGKAPGGGWPAVVCAHGGGGTAYPGWVKNGTAMAMRPSRWTLKATCREVRPMVSRATCR